MLIALDALIGLHHFQEEDLRKINYNKFRPISLVMVIELFYQRKLQHKMKLVDELIDMFVETEPFVPVGDMHHLSYAIRVIDSIKFHQCYYRLNAKVRQ